MTFTGQGLNMSVLCMKVLTEQELLSLFYVLLKNLSASVSLQNNLMDFILQE